MKKPCRPSLFAVVARSAHPTIDVVFQLRSGCLVPFSPAIFKAYDIRGIVPSTLDEDVARNLGRAFGMAAKAKGQTTVAVGRDGRLSGPALSAALMAAVCSWPVAISATADNATSSDSASSRVNRSGRVR